MHLDNFVLARASPATGCKELYVYNMRNGICLKEPIQEDQFFVGQEHQLPPAG